MSNVKALFKAAYKGVPRSGRLVDKVHYYNETIAAGAIRASYSAFTTAPANSLNWSLTQSNMMPYDFVLREIGIRFVGAIASAARDLLAFVPNSLITLKVANKDVLTKIPASCLPEIGGGINYSVDLDASAAPIRCEFGSNGGRGMTETFKFDPIPIPANTRFEVLCETVTGTLVTESYIQYQLKGAELLDVN